LFHLGWSESFRKEKSMNKPLKSPPLLVLAMLVTVSLLSAVQPGFQDQALAQSDELHVVGGSKCAAAWGLGLSLAAAALSPCSIVCATLAWYDLALIGAYCG
jgi:hypothetical protein